MGLHCEERGIYHKQTIAACKLLDTEVAAKYFTEATVSHFERVHCTSLPLLISSLWVTFSLLRCPVGKYIFLILCNYKPPHWNTIRNATSMLLVSYFPKGWPDACDAFACEADCFQRSEKKHVVRFEVAIQTQHDPPVACCCP